MKVTAATTRSRPAALTRTSAALCVAGHVGIHIDRTFALEKVPEALRYVGEGRALGKVVVEVNVD